MSDYTQKFLEDSAVLLGAEGRHEIANAIRDFAAARRKQRGMVVDKVSAAIAALESIIHDEYDGTSLLAGYLAHIEVLRAALAQNTQGEAIAFFAADPAEGDFSMHDTLEAARVDAEKMLGYAQDAASEDGWADEPPQICYGIVLGKCIEKEGSRRPAPDGSEYTELVDYRLTAPVHAERATVPDGMVLVPRMITTEMWKAWEQADLLGESYRQNYAAMLAAAPSQQGGRGFDSPEALAGWLESLHEADADGAITGGKWEVAQVAAHAIRNMSIQQGFVQLPPDWKREGMVVIADALTGRLLGCMGHTTWDAQVRTDTAQGGDAQAALAQNTQGDGACPKCGAPTDPDCGHVGECHAERATVPVDEVSRVAAHMGLAIEYIEKQYPDAKQLDRGPIMRNLKRWRDKLLAVAPPQPTHERVFVGPGHLEQTGYIDPSQPKDAAEVRHG